MLITGTGDRDTQLEATKHELQGFLIKPVGAETAVRVLKAFAHLDATVLEPVEKTTRACTSMPGGTAVTSPLSRNRCARCTNWRWSSSAPARMKPGARRSSRRPTAVVPWP
jgi:hypothetical protein